jgi:hypothetical protein
MKIALAVMSLIVAINSYAADPVYLDQLMETPAATLQQQFQGLKKEGCYSIGNNQFLLISIDKKEGKPWRIALASEPPCKKPHEGPLMDVRQRKDLHLGDNTIKVIEKLGRPDASTTPETALQRLGELEYFYVCRVSEMCARHTSVFIRDGLVTAIAEWYSE